MICIAAAKSGMVSERRRAVRQGNRITKQGNGQALMCMVTEQRSFAMEKNREVKHGTGEAQYGMVTDKIREVVRRN